MSEIIFDMFKNSNVTTTKEKPNMFQIHWFEIEGHSSWELLHENKTEEEFKQDVTDVINAETYSILSKFETKSGFLKYYYFSDYLREMVNKLVETKGYTLPTTTSLVFGDMNGDFCESFKELATAETWKKIESREKAMNKQMEDYTKSMEKSEVELLETATFLGDLMYREYPTTSVYLATNGLIIMEEWVDCDTENNDTFFLYKVYVQELIKFLDNKIDHRNLYFRAWKDAGSLIHSPDEPRKIAVKDLPEDYIPNEGVMFSKEECDDYDKIMIILWEKLQKDEEEYS